MPSGAGGLDKAVELSAVRGVANRPPARCADICGVFVLEDCKMIKAPGNIWISIRGETSSQLVVHFVYATQFALSSSVLQRYCSKGVFEVFEGLGCGEQV